MEKVLLVLVLAVVSASANLLEWSGGLRVRFGMDMDNYYNLPLSVMDAIAEGWTRTPLPEGPMSSLVLYCYVNKMTCTLYDDTGYIAGLQIAFPEDAISNAPFDWEIQGYTRWTPSNDGRSYWAIQQYYVNEEFLATSPTVRLASRDSKKILQLDYMWVTGPYKELVQISTNAAGVMNSEFTEQACIPLMGLHYYHNMSSTLPCNSETLFPWFPMTHGGQLTATGLVAYGQLEEDETRDWFERPERPAVMAIVPRGPECLYALADNPGMITMHIYYMDKPVRLTCL